MCNNTNSTDIRQFGTVGGGGCKVQCYQRYEQEFGAYFLAQPV